MNSNINNVITVLKSGGVYSPLHVKHIHRMCKKHLSLDFNFICLTDFHPTEFGSEIEVIKLKNEFSGWWSKVELFRTDLFKDYNNLYFDLDTIITNSIDFIFQDCEKFTCLEDFGRPQQFGSGVMFWKSNSMYKIYTDFCRNSDYIIRNYRFGDQEWIQQCVKDFDFFQKKFPKKFISYKINYLKAKPAYKESIINHSAVLCFHGKPKPQDCDESIIKSLWNCQ